MPNRIRIAFSVYGAVEGEWLLKWLEFQAQIANYKGYAGMTTMLGSCYVHMNNNQLVVSALEDDVPWDYLLIIEQDMIMPPGLMERVGSYTDPIVGCMFFGRVMDNQRAIPGYWTDDGFFRRMSDEEAGYLLDNPGLHSCGAVGMGCTAIRRDVLEQWSEDRWPWFQTPVTKELAWGHDVWFCKQALEQGWGTVVDTQFCAEHLGTWRSGPKTFRARRVYDQWTRDQEKVLKPILTQTVTR